MIKSKDYDTTVAVKDVPEKRGRKRKVRDDELPNGTGENGLDHNDKGEKIDRDTKKVTRTPVRYNQHTANQETTPTSSAAQPKSPSLSITPSLKIRLPRLSNLNITNNISASLPDTPTRR